MNFACYASTLSMAMLSTDVLRGRWSFVLRIYVSDRLIGRELLVRCVKDGGSTASVSVRLHLVHEERGRPESDMFCQDPT